ncbi:hypothetical protein Ddye_009828 [Dipteronia dyeriana]|uniref:Phytosulfokine n=1 Tax=Dipteronia dyeriana TaxID=168575 RepID=A0AAD9XC21_9ROSI|nr:hypothetical protein Ddye_009828 [Dipteronia dyeriana]
MAKVKVAALFMIALFLFSTLTYAVRPEPSSASNFPAKTQHGEMKGEQLLEESCDGVGEDECLMRRTLAAHIDYIYTQKTKP